MRIIQWAMVMLLLCSLAGCGQPQESLARSDDAAPLPPLTKAEAKADALVATLKREAEVRKQSARTSAAYSLLMTLRAQLELYYIQHNDRYPDLVEQQWQQVVNKTGVDGVVDEEGNCGPYIGQAPNNPFTESNQVTADTTGDWQFNPATGELRLVIASDLAALLCPQLKHGRDYVVSTGDAAGVRYQLEQELGDIERALARHKVTADEMKSIKRELPQVEKTLAEMNAKFRSLDRINDATQDIKQSAIEAGLTIEEVEPLKIATSPLVVAQPMRVKVRGSLANVSKWAARIDDGLNHRIDVFQVIDNGQFVAFNMGLVAFYVPNLVEMAEHRAANSSTTPEKLAARLTELESLIARANTDKLISPQEHQAAKVRLRAAIEQQSSSNDYAIKQRFAIRKRALSDLINMVKAVDEIDRPTAAIKRLVDALPANVKLTDIQMVREKSRSKIRFEAVGLTPDLNTVTLAVNKLNRSRHFQGIQLLGVNKPTIEGSTETRTPFRIRGTSLASE